MFREIAPRELQFIQHVAAVMGFILGLVQVVLYLVIPGKNADYYILPLSGLFIGYLTNWLALKMTFAPVWPHILCGGYVNWQGVFLKRQQEAANKMSQLICEKVVDFRAMIEYTAKSNSSGFDMMIAIYTRHVGQMIDSGIGGTRSIIPNFIGQHVDVIKQDVIDITLELLPTHSKELEAYMDQVMQ